MCKNFRIQVTPLTTTPKVSNVRRIKRRKRRYSLHIPTATHDFQGRCSIELPARQEFHQGLRSVESPDPTSTDCAETSLLDISDPVQSAPDNSVSNIGDHRAPTPLLPFYDEDRLLAFESSSVVSEPYWLAGSDVSSIYTARTTCNTPSTTESHASNSPTPSEFSAQTSNVVCCRKCSLKFSGSPQDAKSNLGRHLRTSPRHNRNAGLKCPLPQCRARPAIRSENLGPHLLRFHRIFSASERQTMINNARSILHRPSTLSAM